MKFQNKRLTAIFLFVAFLLLVPFVAMRVSNEVKWSWFDFVVAGGLLFGTGLICELVWRKVKKFEYRIALVAVILVALLIVWAELAVGLIGTPLAGS